MGLIKDRTLGVLKERAEFENFRGHIPKPMNATFGRDGLFVIFCRQYGLRYYRPQVSIHEHFYTTQAQNEDKNLRFIPHRHFGLANLASKRFFKRLASHGSDGAGDLLH